MEKDYNEIRALLSTLEDDLGEICLVSEKVSGIYYLSARQDGEPFAGEYYAATDTPIISQQARAHGRMCGGNPALMEKAWEIFEKYEQDNAE